MGTHSKGNNYFGPGAGLAARARKLRAQIARRQKELNKVLGKLQALMRARP